MTGSVIPFPQKEPAVLLVDALGNGHLITDSDVELWLDGGFALPCEPIIRAIIAEWWLAATNPETKEANHVSP
jgi:hypothetical protein